MSKSSKRPTFNESLINDNINYQILIQQYQQRTYILEQEIQALKRFEEDYHKLEQEVKKLKQSNFNIGKEVGVMMLRNKEYLDEKKRLEKEIQDLNIKNNALEAVYANLQKAFEYQAHQYKYSKSTYAKDLNDFLGVVNIYTNELTSVKQQLSDEQSKFSELNKILLFCYSGILKAINAPSQLEMIEELAKLIPA
jgi:DNA repair exonuclease SbcCD ATPase subunit